MIPAVNVQEVTLAALLHDIGKLLQRAHASDASLPEQVRARQSVVLPTFDGRYTHWHALWSDAFFEWMEHNGLTFPSGINAHTVRDLAVYHHRPTGGTSWLITEADRLASGQDRKPRDESAEADPAKRRAFREKSLLSLPQGASLGLGKTEPAFHAALPFEPEAIFPGPATPAEQPARYAALWTGFQHGFATLCAELPNQSALFEQGLLALSEQFLWAIPSSTMDQPDVPLHDHARAVAAIAACLFLYHQAHDELADDAKIRDRNAKKFRVLEGDLSGIQASLFRLKSEQVKGVNRILRARSFLISATAEAAALLCRETFGLPASTTLLAAGGRFRLLLPNLDDVSSRIAELRRSFDRWVAERWSGDLAIILAMTEPFSPALLHRDHTHELARLAGAAIERAKLSPLAGRITEPILRAPVYGAAGACASCGVRPATRKDPHEGAEIVRCEVCHEAHEIGSALPRAAGFRLDRLGRIPHPRPFATFFDAYELRICGADDPLLPYGSDRSAVALAAAFRTDAPAPFGRFVANYVPRLEDPSDSRYAGLSEDARKVAAGGSKTFEHLAADAREVPSGSEGPIVGRAMLAVLKADVDRLGFVFGYGLGQDATPARIATLSRMLDAFFAGYLPALLRKDFAHTYTVYAGGDDLLVIAPWVSAVRLASRLRAEFGRFSNGNPNLTLSAGVALIHPNEPLNRAVREAEHRLEAAKNAGRDRVSLITDDPIRWSELDLALDLSEHLNELIRARRLPISFLYSLLRFWADKEATEKRRDLRKAIWRARFSYHLARFAERDQKESGGPDFTPLLQRIMGLSAEPSVAAPIPISIALWRNR